MGTIELIIMIVVYFLIRNYKKERSYINTVIEIVIFTSIIVQIEHLHPEQKLISDGILATYHFQAILALNLIAFSRSVIKSGHFKKISLKNKVAIVLLTLLTTFCATYAIYYGGDWLANFFIFTLSRIIVYFSYFAFILKCFLKVYHKALESITDGMIGSIQRKGK